jgi:U6 snRNA-associated Sm-like protein LSm6
VDQVHSQLPCPLLPLPPSLPLSLSLSHNSTTGYPQGKTVLVKTNSGSDFKGILHCLDGFLNIALEHCEEWSNGECRRTYGDAFIRGNNVTFISLIGK